MDDDEENDDKTVDEGNGGCGGSVLCDCPSLSMGEDALKTAYGRSATGTGLRSMES